MPTKALHNALGKHLFRDFGKWAAERIPIAGSFLKWVYQSLPSYLHDHPADFLQRYFDGWHSVRFIQIGAHNGISGDPIRPNIIKNSAWSGVLIEPNPHLFKQLKANYAEHPGLSFKCAAVSDSAGVLPFYILADPAQQFPSWWSESSSLHKDHLTRHLPPESHSFIEQIEVSVLTLHDVIIENNAADVNLVAMDVEGHELLILQYILRSDIRPEVLLFEHKHMPQMALQDAALAFRPLGYHVKVYGRDAIFYRSKDPRRS